MSDKITKSKPINIPPSKPKPKLKRLKPKISGKNLITFTANGYYISGLLNNDSQNIKIKSKKISINRVGNNFEIYSNDLKLIINLNGEIILYEKIFNPDTLY